MLLKKTLNPFILKKNPKKNDKPTNEMCIRDSSACRQHSRKNNGGGKNEKKKNSKRKPEIGITKKGDEHLNQRPTREQVEFLRRQYLSLIHI